MVADVAEGKERGKYKYLYNSKADITQWNRKVYNNENTVCSGILLCLFKFAPSTFKLGEHELENRFLELSCSC